MKHLGLRQTKLVPVNSSEVPTTPDSEKKEFESEIKIASVAPEMDADHGPRSPQTQKADPEIERRVKITELKTQKTTDRGEAQSRIEFIALAIPELGPVSSRASIPAAESNEDNKNDEQDDTKLAFLKDRIERIRADKESLEQIQRFTELEEATKMEIMFAKLKPSKSS